MRIQSINAENVLPVEKFSVEGLSDLVVIAGPNGVGKTRLINSLITYFQNFSGNSVSFIIHSTNDDEVKAWGKREIDTKNPQDANLLKHTLQQNRRRRNFKSSILYYESNRTIQNIQPLKFEWDIADPWEEQVSWNLTFGGLSNRFQDTLHTIFKKIQSQKTSIANAAIQLKQKGHTSMNLDFSDPLEPFRYAFHQLLGPKKLERADARSNTLYFSYKGNEYDINVLSSGEREVLNIAFDFILRSPSDCVIFFDEPELHLHPELSAKLISTLKSVGINNQFVLCTHSPDIISASLDDSVIFLTPKKDGIHNQAVLLKPDDSSTEALHRLGQSVGVVSLGKKIVLIEGNNASLDKQTYTHILKNRYSDLVLLPSGGKGNLKAFDSIAKEILDKTIWGIDFYMLADRDASPSGIKSIELTTRTKGRFYALSKYHLENYFLDEYVIAGMFQHMETEGSWLRDPSKINIAFKEIALAQVPYATSLMVSKHIRDMVGNVDIMAKGCHDKSKDELSLLIDGQRKKEEERITIAFSAENLKTLTSEIFDRLESSIKNDSEVWKTDLPGKPILKIFCNKANIQDGRFKTLYIHEAEKQNANPFQEIIDIFGNFSEMKAIIEQ